MPEERPYMHELADIYTEYVYGPKYEPTSDQLNLAEGVIRRSRYESGRDAFGTCSDLAADPHFRGNSVLVLMSMFADENLVMPDNWRSNPEITRTILLMVSHIDLGMLKAQKESLKHQGGSKMLDEQIVRWMGLIEMLQARGQ